MHPILALVTFNIYPAKMGGQKGVALFYRYLQKKLPVTIAASAQEEKNDAIVCLAPNKSSYLNLFRIKKLTQIAVQKKAELIIAEHSYAGWTALLLSKRIKKPFIIHSHNIESLRFKQMNRWWWRLYYPYEKWIHQKAAHSFFISEEDSLFAQQHFGLAPQKCSVVTYGIETLAQVTDKMTLRRKLLLPEDRKLLFFNGTLDYKPNYDAVCTILNTLLPMLQKKLEHFCIVVCGSRVPDDLHKKMQESENILFAGMVPDIQAYYQSADLFINPVLNDTGVKTKLIEALAHHCTTVSTEMGARGLKKEACGNKLILVADNHWEAFTNTVVEALAQKPSSTPAAFFDYYHWENITHKASQTINSIIENHGRS